MPRVTSKLSSSNSRIFCKYNYYLFINNALRCISILDGHTGTIARQLDSNHSRAVHCIALPKPTIHVPIGPDAYNMFLTAAMDNVISLWDIRDPVCVARYSSHVNRREPITCDISPCLRYIATGLQIQCIIIK